MRMRLAIATLIAIPVLVIGVSAADADKGWHDIPLVEAYGGQPTGMPLTVPGSTSASVTAAAAVSDPLPQPGDWVKVLNADGDFVKCPDGTDLQVRTPGPPPSTGAVLPAGRIAPGAESDSDGDLLRAGSSRVAVDYQAERCGSGNAPYWVNFGDE